MKLEACGITDVGCVRTNNEDNYLCDTARGLFVVCDGMGGHAAGEVASELACTLICERVDTLRSTLFPAGTPWRADKAVQLTSAMIQAMAEMSQHIAQVGHAQAQKKGMGTTCTALWFVDDSHALVAHIGDSRLYLESPFDHGTVTSDHTLVEELVARGLIGAEDAKRHPQAHILSRALGASSALGADCFVMRVAPEDQFLLCSDGLHAYLPSAGELRLSPAAHGAPTLHHTLQKFIDSAKSQGGHDNLTGVLVHLQAADGQEADAAPPLPALLQLIASHPALASLPPMLLRRMAALVVPCAPSGAAPAAGISWLAEGALTTTQPEVRSLTLQAPAWVAPEPLGLGNPAPIAALESPADGMLWHLPANALMDVAMGHPSTGAHILGALTHEPSLVDFGAHPADATDA